MTIPNLKEIIQKRILNDDEENRRAVEPIEHFHASSVGYCERQIFLTKIHAKLWDLKTKGSMESGSAIHGRIQWYKEIRELFDIEKPVEVPIEGTPVKIIGSADIVAKDNSYVADIKSTNSLVYLQTSPMSQHVPQILSYMKGLGAKDGELLYVEKGSMEMISHLLRFDQVIFDHTCQKVLRVYEALKKWDEEGKFEKIPFPKCPCFFCKSETLHPSILKLLKE